MNSACPRRVSLIIALGLPAIPSPTIGATTGDRPAARRLEDLASGPGKLTLAMGITRALNGADVTRGGLVVRRPAVERAFETDVTPRIGIRQCADWPLRLIIRGNRFVTKGTFRAAGFVR